MVRILRIFVTTLILLNTLAPIQACDMSAFDQTDFSDRCQRLIDICDKAYIAMSAQHPDTDARLSEVSKDWIDFYLSHGNDKVQPPNMSMIPAEIWNRNMTELGKSFSDFIHKKISAEDYQNIILKISILKNEAHLTSLHNCFKASELCETDVTKIENWQLWLSARLLNSASLVYSYVENLPKLLSELKMETEEHKESIERFVALTEDAPNELKQSFFDNINNAIQESLNKWEIMCFYK